MTWRIGVATGCCAGRQVLEVLDAADDAGFLGIELGTPPGHFAPWDPSQVDAVIVTGDSLFLLQGRKVDELLARHRLPSVVPGRDFVLVAGGLISYLQSPDEVMARSVSQVDRILRGAKPADLPVEQATRFELFISRRVAKALGLKLPQSLLLRATEVIE